jgi:endo-beta-N-acetylglucosaminidase D
LKKLSDKSSKEEEEEETDSNRFIYADKLIEVAKHFKFDGYLINIEAKITNPK